MHISWTECHKNPDEVSSVIIQDSLNKTSVYSYSYRTQTQKPYFQGLYFRFSKETHRQTHRHRQTDRQTDRENVRLYWSEAGFTDLRWKSSTIIISLHYTQLWRGLFIVDALRTLYFFIPCIVLSSCSFFLQCNNRISDRLRRHPVTHG